VIEGIQDSGAVPDSSTISTLAECFYDGAEIGSTGILAYEN